MLESLSTKATITKIHAKYGKMLTKQNYSELLNKQSVSEIAAYLKKNTRYSGILSSIDTNTIHRGLLEALIRSNNFNTYVELCKFQQLDDIPFYNYEVMREEIEQILSCILHINAGNQEEYIASLPSYMISHASFDMLSLAKSKKFSDLLNVIKNTEYYEALKNVSPDENGQINYLRCEVLLRTQYYKKLFALVDKDFSKSVAKELKKIILTQIDLINYINSYRLKAFFNSDSGTIKANMLPFYGRISEKKMFTFYEAKNKDEMLDMFKKTIYAKKLDEINPDIMEQNIYKIRYKSARASLRNAQAAPIALYSFIFLCEIEAMNLISIVEGIRYKTPPSLIEKLLII
jgi:V/A-type H+-transporting ATPase subunit C